MKGSEKGDEFLQSLFKSLDRLKSKDDRKCPERKVIVRRLPPSMTEERFLNEISPLPENNYMYFVPGDSQSAPFHHSRVYINFLKDEDMYMFTEKFDGYVFVDDTGDEYPATVELAPYQRVPKKKLDKDPNWGKIHDNPIFLEFKQNFEQKSIDTTLKTTQHFFESVEDKSHEQESSTPLLEYLSKQNDRQKIKITHNERHKKVFRKREKEDIRRPKKEDRDVSIKHKPILKSNVINKKPFDDKPIKETKKIAKNFRENTFSEEDNKKYHEDNHRMKAEYNSKYDEIKKVEFRIKSNLKLNEFKKNIDNLFTKPDKSYESYKDNDNSESKKKQETLLPDLSTSKSSSSMSHRNRKDQDCNESGDVDNTKKHSSEIDRKSISRHLENRCQDSKGDRRIRNKDRPAIEIYRPGMGRLSKIKSDNDYPDSESKN
ncbi:regulator of nonsense transcripts 3B [Daktulosphaira vitifoliae]|uniref:regulator of nonsense transcripts 3B n=1 Tax=Daktulosphaira vitifoliae TaxID=58002 RepID=UPI0021AA0F56|nr:regulator of nonsense transcripts 3B [Daktulosphaira vitifoliae]